MAKLYIQQIRPHLEYGAPIWHPYLSSHTSALERVQKFALRMYLGEWTYSYEDLLEFFNLPTLQNRRHLLSICLFFKLINGLTVYRGCAGLSKAAFQTATASPHPFLCPHCRLVAQSSELLALKSAVNTLSIELSSLKVVVEDLMANINTAYVPNPTDFPSLAHKQVLPPSSLGNHVPVDPLANKSHVHSTRHDQHHHSSDKKYNIVLFGVYECSVDTSRYESLESDLNIVSEVVSGIDDSIQKHSIKDCFRLGKFNRASRCPRPILVKFIRTADVSRILSKKASLSHRFSIKPDLSPEERLWEAALLKERWNLIQGGTDRKLIKIRNNSILVSGKVHGRVVNSLFQISAPSTRSQSITSHLPTSRSASPSPKSSPATGPHDTAISLSD